MRYPWSDMPKPLRKALAACDPERAVEIGCRLCERKGIDMNLHFGGWTGATRSSRPWLRHLGG